MKNKKKKTKKSRGGENKNPRTQREDSGLGQWGLEPPKIYRSDQRLNDFSNAERNRQRKDNSKKVPKNITELILWKNKKDNFTNESVEEYNSNYTNKQQSI